MPNDGIPDRAVAARTTDDATPFVRVWDEQARASGRARRRARVARGLRESLQVVMTALAIFFVSTVAVQGYEVEGPSMQPNYHTGQRVFVNKLVYRPWEEARWLPAPLRPSGEGRVFHAPRRGEVVVFEPPFHSHTALIKRVVAAPGDHVEVRGGRVYVNDALVEETYLPAGERTSCGGAWCNVWLGAGEFYVLGDNRPNSSDSRAWGPIRQDRISGKAWFIFSPFREFGHAP